MFLQHGVFSSSACWLINPSHRSLGQNHYFMMGLRYVSNSDNTIDSVAFPLFSLHHVWRALFSLDVYNSSDLPLLDYSVIDYDLWLDLLQPSVSATWDTTSGLAIREATFILAIMSISILMRTRNSGTTRKWISDSFSGSFHFKDFTIMQI